MSHFFGTLSPFEVIVSIVALVTGAYTFYKSFIEKTKVSMYPSDSVGLVVLADGSASSFNLLCNFVNTTNKIGTLQHLEAVIRMPSGNQLLFTWSQFFRFSEGGISLEKETDVYPVPVYQRDSKPLFIQFQLLSPPDSFKWEEGYYQFKIRGWVNLKNRSTKPNLLSSFNVNVSSELAVDLRQTATAPYVRNVPLQEWAPHS